MVAWNSLYNLLIYVYVILQLYNPTGNTLLMAFLSPKCINRNFFHHICHKFFWIFFLFYIFASIHLLPQSWLKRPICVKVLLKLSETEWNWETSNPTFRHSSVFSIEVQFVINSALVFCFKTSNISFNSAHILQLKMITLIMESHCLWECLESGRNFIMETDKE